MPLLFPLTTQFLRFCSNFTPPATKSFLLNVFKRSHVTILKLSSSRLPQRYRKLTTGRTALNITIQALIIHRVHAANCVDPEISYHDFVALMKKGRIILIDVRHPCEVQEDGKIPGSINIPLQELKYALGMLSDKGFKQKYGVRKPGLNDPLVFHCKSGVRSKDAVIVAEALGYTNVKHYAGGILDWLKRTNLTKLPDKN